MVYNGVALSNKLPGGRKGISIEVSDLYISFQIDENKINWPVNSINIEQGGTGNQLIYIKNQSDSELSIYTRDKSFLKNPNLKSHIHLRQSTNKIIGNIFKNRLFIAIVLIIVVSIPFGFYIFREAVVHKIADKVPVEWEVKIGEQLFSALKEQYKIVEDSAVSAKFKSLFEPIEAAAKYTEVDFKFYLCKNEELNAFALPGGFVVINSGTINNIDRIEELFGVIAHEIAHVTERHHIRGAIGNLGSYLILQAFLGDFGAIERLGETASQLNSLSYSRKYEEESDLTGYKYLVESKIDPSGMIDFFKRLDITAGDSVDKKLKESVEKLNSYVGTHPGTQERIDYLSKKIQKENPKFVSQEFDLEQFREFVEIKLK